MAWIVDGFDAWILHKLGKVSKCLIVYNYQLSIILFRLGEYLFPPVDAEAPSAKATNVDEHNRDAEKSESESEGDDDVDGDDGQMKKKPKKEKVGFRDRKVSPYSMSI